MAVKHATANHTGWPNYHTGDYLQTMCSAVTNAAMTDARADFSPIYIGKATSVDQLAIRVTTLAASSAVRLGIYRDDGTGRPGRLVVEAPSTVDTTTTGAKTVNLSAAVKLVPGMYWLVCQAEGGAPTITSCANFNMFVISVSATSAGINGWRATHTGAFAADMAGTSWSQNVSPGVVYAKIA